MCFLPTQEWRCTRRTTELDRQGHQKYQKEMSQPTPQGQCQTSLHQLPKGRPKHPTNKCTGSYQPDYSWTGWDCFNLRTWHNYQWHFLKSVVKKHIRRLPELQDLWNYPCGSIEGTFPNESTDISNIWIRFHSMMQRLRTKIMSWVNDDNMTLHLNGFVLHRGVCVHAFRKSIHE